MAEFAEDIGRLDALNLAVVNSVLLPGPIESGQITSVLTVRISVSVQVTTNLTINYPLSIS